MIQHDQLFFLIGILILVWSHWVGDFVMQLDRMARNKSTDNKALTEHILWYSLIIFIGGLFIFDFDFVLTALFTGVNGILHYYTDYFTSRRNSRLYKEGKLGSDKFPNLGFYSTIGFDQSIHYTCLFVTYYLMVVVL